MLTLDRQHKLTLVETTFCNSQRLTILNAPARLLPALKSHSICMVLPTEHNVFPTSHGAYACSPCMCSNFLAGGLDAGYTTTGWALGVLKLSAA